MDTYQWQHGLNFCAIFDAIDPSPHVGSWFLIKPMELWQLANFSQFTVFWFGAEICQDKRLTSLTRSFHANWQLEIQFLENHCRVFLRQVTRRIISIDSSIRWSCHKGHAKASWDPQSQHLSILQRCSHAQKQLLFCQGKRLENTW
jgi:hypothetical protein